MAQKANLATGKSKVIKSGALPMGKTPVVSPATKNPSGRNGNKRQAPSVTTSGS